MEMILNFEEIPHDEGETLRLIKCNKTDVGHIYYCENDCKYYWVLEDESEVNCE